MLIHNDKSTHTPQFFSGQAGCFCCAPPPPPEPSVAYYGRGSSYNPIPLCCDRHPVADTLTATITSGTCTCLVGQSWTLKRRRQLVSEGTPSPCVWNTEGGACINGGPSGLSCNSGFSGGVGAGYQSNSCNSGNLSIGIIFAIGDGTAGKFGIPNAKLCLTVCAGGGVFGFQIIDSNTIQVSSCSPLVWTSNTFNSVNLLFQNVCGLGANVGGTVVFTVTE